MQHCFYPISSKARAKTAGIVNKVYSAANIKTHQSAVRITISTIAPANNPTFMAATSPGESDSVVAVGREFCFLAIDVLRSFKRVSEREAILMCDLARGCVGP